LITQLVAEGKRVLFVAEKRAALDAVIKRLTAQGLGHLTLDLHGASVSRKEVMARLATSLDAIRQALPVDSTAIHRELETKRAVLNSHLQLLHRQRQPTQMSVFRMYESLMRMPAAAKSRVRWRSAECLALTDARVAAIEAMLTEAANTPGLFLGDDPSRWNNALIDTGSDAQRGVDLVEQIVRVLWPSLGEVLDAVVSDAGIRRPQTLAEYSALSVTLQRTQRLLANHDASLFSLALPTLATNLAPASRGWLKTVWAFLTNAEFRNARKEVLGVRKAKASSAELAQEANEASSLKKSWTGWESSRAPFVPARSHEYAERLSKLLTAVGELQQILGGQDLLSMPIKECEATLAALASDRLTPFKLRRVRELRRLLIKDGVGDLVAELKSDAVASDLWTMRLRSAWLNSSIELAQAEDPTLATFNGRSHDRIVESFKQLDKERIDLAAARVRRLHGEAATSAMNEFPDQTQIVRREARKRARHIPLRQLLADAPDVLTRVAPCWIASPLSVSQLLDGERRHFDVVIFDEASQILPEEAIPSLFRASQVVVAGDSKQLPPTTFFATRADVDDEEIVSDETGTLEAITGFESLLDTLSVFTSNWMLEWHYRSEDERLIAFSNHFIYDGRLITFPSAKDFSPISHTLVENRTGLSGQDESSSAEVEEVVRRVIQHVETLPNETLGVITMGIKHANRVQAALDRALLLRPDLGEFFNQEKEERFFVKNLETVQGDERDAIILTIGYGKNPDGELPHRFGPLTQDVGYRRLNVAITRARRRMSVLSSFSHFDVDLNRSGSRGVRLLKTFLQYAASGASSLPGGEEVGRMPVNAFEADIQAALEARGIRVLPQYGTSRFCIDLVATHPDKPGLPVLAIECDGQTYHSSATARDRDRLRQEQLMRQGWRFHRIWSTDWFHRREEEIERAVTAFNEAVAASDKSPTPPSPAGSTGIRSTATPRRNGARPTIRPGVPHTDYSDRELRALVKWIVSDGRLRTDDELMKEMLNELGLRRLGDRMRTRFAEAIAGADH
jgi:very-short-patch-repair endonuclease